MSTNYTRPRRVSPFGGDLPDTSPSADYLSATENADTPPAPRRPKPRQKQQNILSGDKPVLGRPEGATQMTAPPPVTSSKNYSRPLDTTDKFIASSPAPQQNNYTMRGGLISGHGQTAPPASRTVEFNGKKMPFQPTPAFTPTAAKERTTPTYDVRTGKPTYLETSSVPTDEQGNVDTSTMKPQDRDQYYQAVARSRRTVAPLSEVSNPLTTVRDFANEHPKLTNPLLSPLSDENIKQFNAGVTSGVLGSREEPSTVGGMVSKQVGGSVPFLAAMGAAPEAELPEGATALQRILSSGLHTGGIAGTTEAAKQLYTGEAEKNPEEALKNVGLSTAGGIVAGAGGELIPGQASSVPGALTRAAGRFLTGTTANAAPDIAMRVAGGEPVSKAASEALPQAALWALPSSLGVSAKPGEQPIVKETSPTADVKGVDQAPNYPGPPGSGEFTPKQIDQAVQFDTQGNRVVPGQTFVHADGSTAPFPLDRSAVKIADESTFKTNPSQPVVAPPESFITKENQVTPSGPPAPVTQEVPQTRADQLDRRVAVNRQLQQAEQQESRPGERVDLYKGLGYSGPLDEEGFPITDKPAAGGRTLPFGSQSDISQTHYVPSAENPRVLEEVPAPTGKMFNVQPGQAPDIQGVMYDQQADQNLNRIARPTERMPAYGDVIEPTTDPARAEALRQAQEETNAIMGGTEMDAEQAQRLINAAKMGVRGGGGNRAPVEQAPPVVKTPKVEKATGEDFAPAGTAPTSVIPKGLQPDILPPSRPGEAFNAPVGVGRENPTVNMRQIEQNTPIDISGRLSEPSQPRQSVTKSLDQMERTGNFGGEAITDKDPIAQGVLKGIKNGGYSDAVESFARSYGDGQGVIGQKGAGASSVVLDIGNGQVLRLGNGEATKIPNSDLINQPIASKQFGGVRGEVYPALDTSNISEADVAAMSKALDAQGLQFSDAGADNLGRDSNGKLKVIDPGAVSVKPTGKSFDPFAPTGDSGPLPPTGPLDENIKKGDEAGKFFDGLGEKPPTEAPLTASGNQKQLRGDVNGQPDYNAIRQQQAEAAKRSPVDLPKATADNPAPEKQYPPYSIFNADPRDLVRDPERLQFKQNVNEKGVTPALSDVEEWNPRLGGVVNVWRDPETGIIHPLNGHHRHELAMRMIEQGKPVEPFHISFVDADTPQQARVQGGLLNMGENSASAKVTDIAGVLREGGYTPDDLKKMGISLSEGKNQDALALSKIDDGLFDMTRRGVIPENQAVSIAKAFPDDKALQWQLYRNIEGKRVNADQISEMADFMKAAPVHEMEQQDLFGTTTQRESLYREMGSLSQNIKDRMSQDKRFFGKIGSEKAAEMGARAGNQLNIEANRKIADQADQALGVFDRLKTMNGPINDALQEGAVKLKEGGNADAIRKEVYENVIRAVQKELGGQQTETGGERESDALGHGDTGRQQVSLFGSADASELPGGRSGQLPGNERLPNAAGAGEQAATGANNEQRPGRSDRLRAISEEAGQKADELITEFNRKLGRISSNPFADPELYTLAARIAGHKFVQHGANFAAWSVDMVNRLGDEIKPHLNDLYSIAQSMVNGPDEKSGPLPTSEFSQYRNQGPMPTKQNDMFRPSVTDRLGPVDYGQPFTAESPRGPQGTMLPRTGPLEPPGSARAAQGAETFKGGGRLQTPQEIRENAAMDKEFPAGPQNVKMGGQAPLPMKGGEWFGGSKDKPELPAQAVAPENQPVLKTLSKLMNASKLADLGGLIHTVGTSVYSGAQNIFGRNIGSVVDKALTAFPHVDEGGARVKGERTEAGSTLGENAANYMKAASSWIGKAKDFIPHDDNGFSAIGESRSKTGDSPFWKVIDGATNKVGEYRQWLHKPSIVHSLLSSMENQVKVDELNAKASGSDFDGDAVRKLIQDRFNGKLKEGTPERAQADDFIKRAWGEAKENALMGDNWASKKLTGIKDKLWNNQAENPAVKLGGQMAAFALDQLQPFVKISANFVGKGAIEPITEPIKAVGSIYNSVKRGGLTTADQKQIVNAFKAGTPAAVAFLAGGILRSQGLYTPSIDFGNDKDKQQKYLNEAANRDAGTIKIGDYRLPALALGPLKLALDLGAKNYDYTNGPQSKKLDTGDYVSKMAAAYTGEIGEHPLVRGITNVAQDISGPEGGFKREMSRRVGEIVPPVVNKTGSAYNWFTGQNPPPLRQGRDAGKDFIGGTIDELKSRTGMDSDLQPRIGALGHPVYGKPFNPLRMTEETQSPVIQTADKYGFGLNKSTPKPNESPRDFTARAKAEGANVERNLTDLINSPVWAQADRARKADLWKHTEQSSRHADSDGMLNRIDPFDTSDKLDEQEDKKKNATRATVQLEQ